MNMNTKKGPIEEILDGLQEQSACLTKEEVKAELVARGVNIEGLISRTQELVQKALKEERMGWMKEADKQNTILEAAASRVSSWLNRREEEILAAFDALTSSGGPALAFRNQSKLTVEDMARILDKQEELKSRENHGSDSTAK